MTTASDDFISAASACGITVAPACIPLFHAYYRELVSWNERMNLTRIYGERDVFINHFLDSLISERFIPQHASLLDIGSGAGFPGIPLKILRPDLEVTLVDSIFKKVAFQRHLIRILRLERIRSVHRRVGQSGDDRGVFTVCISRAFGSLPSLFAAAVPALAPGGRIIALKGPRFAEELREAEGDLRARGLTLQAEHSVVLPHTRVRRAVLVFALHTVPEGYHTR